MVGARIVVYIDRCMKFNLPNGTTVDVLESVLHNMKVWIQNDISKPESCGFVLGYENYDTHNITLSDITVPQPKDYRSRVFCKIKDVIHFDLLKNSKKQSNYYMGVWHTHPQKVPTPSDIDFHNWYEILKKDKTASNYAFFIILGEIEYRIWVGDFSTCTITEIHETKIVDGLYVKG